MFIYEDYSHNCTHILQPILVSQRPYHCRLQEHPGKEPNDHKMDFVLEAGGSMMQLLQVGV